MLDQTTRNAIEDAVGHTFRDPSLLELAMTHASNSENGLQSNERLEFLGDAVLGMVVCDMLYRKYPLLREGEMTKIKSLVVSREICATLATQIGLDKMLILGKGMKNGGALPGSLAAAAFESIIGALYLDAGCGCAADFVGKLLEPVVDSAAACGHQHNFKSVLQQHAQGEFGSVPVYRVLDEQGPDHAKAFKVCVEIAGKRFEPSWGATKKKAEQEAALIALREMGVVRDGENGQLVLVIRDTEL